MSLNEWRGLLVLVLVLVSGYMAYRVGRMDGYEKGKEKGFKNGFCAKEIEEAKKCK